MIFDQQNWVQYHRFVVVRTVSIFWLCFYQTRSAWSMDQGSTKKRSAVHNFVPTVTKFCVMWEGLSLPHGTKFGNCRGEIVNRRMVFIWSLIHGSGWSRLIKAEPGQPYKPTYAIHINVKTNITTWEIYHWEWIDINIKVNIYLKFKYLFQYIKVQAGENINTPWSILCYAVIHQCTHNHITDYN